MRYSKRMATTDFVQVDVMLIPAQQNPFNPNNLALLTTESPIVGIEDFTAHTSLQGVGTTYGTASETYKMANSVFSQLPNILTGNGSLAIIPFDGVNATRSSIKTENLTAKINTFEAITAGKIKITVDGAVYNLNEIDFTNIASLADLVKVLYKKLPQGKIKITIEDGSLRFSSLKYGANSTILIEAGTLTGTDLLDTTLLNSTTFTTTTGVNASGETLVEAITRVMALPEGERPNFESVITNLNFELDYATNSYLQNIASYLKGLEKIFIHSFSSLNDVANALLIKNASYTDCRLIYHKDDELLEMRAGASGRLFSNNTSFPLLSATLNKKQIVGITPCLYLTDTDKQNLKNNVGVDYYISNLGTPAYVSTGANGGYIDDIYNVKIIKLESLTTYNNALDSLTKIPQTQAGTGSLSGPIRQNLIKLRANGIIGIGIKWNSNTRPASKTPEEFDRIMYDEGFFVEEIDITTQSQADREGRKAPPVPMYIQFAGAMQNVSSVIFIQR